VVVDVSAKKRKRLTEEHKRKIGNSLKGRTVSESRKKALKEQIKEHYRNHPEFKGELRLKAIRQWNDPLMRRKMTAGINEAHEREYEKYCKASKKGHNTPEYFRKRSKISRELWQNPEYKQKVSTSVSEAIKKLWRENEEYRKNWYKAKTAGFLTNPTPYEDILYNVLIPIFPDLRRQVKIGRYICDIIIPLSSLIIEVDGYPKPPERDEFLKSEGFEVLHIWNHELRDDLEECVTRISTMCDM